MFKHLKELGSVFKRKPQEQEAPPPIGGLHLSPESPELCEWLKTLSEKVVSDPSVAKLVQNRVRDSRDAILASVLEWGVSHHAFLEVLAYVARGKKYDEGDLDAEVSMHMLQTAAIIIAITGELEKLHKEGYTTTTLTSDEVQELIRKSGVN